MSDTPAVSDRTPLSSLKEKDSLKGKVTRIELSGAVVDVGAERDGLLHISTIRKDPVNNVQDVLQIGQEVEVWIRKVNPQKGELQLTMIRPLALEWSDLRNGMTVRGKVTRLEKFGAFLDFGAERPGLIHVSELSGDYVKDPSEVVRVGDELEVVVLEINRKKKQIHLSKKALDARETIEEDTSESDGPEEKPITMMEAAFLKAQSIENEAHRVAGRSPLPKLSTREKRLQQEDLLMRTLQTASRK